MNRRHRLRYALLALFQPMASMAQIPGLSKPEPAPVEEKAEAPATIAIANIPLKAEEDERFIQEARQRAESANKAPVLEKQLKEIQKSVVLLSQKSQSSKLDGVQISRLESLDRHFTRRLAGAPQVADILLLQPGLDQLHLGLWTGTGLVHAHAGLRRVVETPGQPSFPLLGIWYQETD